MQILRFASAHSIPWKRAAPGMVLISGMLGWGAVELVRLGMPAFHSLTLAPPRIPVSLVLPLEQAGWVALGLGASLLSWLVSRRLVGGSGLL